jgi:hypothetical protein
MYLPQDAYSRELQEAREAYEEQTSHLTQPDPAYEAMIAAEKRAELSPPGSHDEEPWEEQWGKERKLEDGYYREGRWA